MSFALAIVLILALFVIYYLIISIYIVLFRVTGMTYEKARFQVISMLTNAGFTTAESEVIVSHPTRRKLATATMLTGYVFSVLFVSLVINVATTFKDLLNNLVNSELVFVLIGFGAFVVILVLARLPFIKRPFERLIEKIGYHFMARGKSANKINVIDNYGKASIFEIMVNKVPDCLTDKTVAEANLISLYSIKLLFVKRKGRAIDVNKDTMIQKGDSIVVFGDAECVHRLFAIKLKANETKKEKRKIINDIEVLENYETGALCEINLRVMPEAIEGKSLYDSGIKNLGMNVIMARRNNKAIEISKDTVLEENDRVILYGPYAAVKELFGSCYRDVELK